MSHTLKSGNVRFHYNSDFSGKIFITHPGDYYSRGEVTVEMTDIILFVEEWYRSLSKNPITCIEGEMVNWIHKDMESLPTSESSTPSDFGVEPKEPKKQCDVRTPTKRHELDEDLFMLRTSDGRYGWSLYNRKHEDVENTVGRAIEVAEGRACLFNRLKNMLMMRIKKYENLPGNPRATRLRAVYHALRKFHWDMEKQEAEKVGVYEGHGGKVFVNGERVGTLGKWNADISGIREG